MTPGGNDITIPAKPTTFLREFVETFFKRRWRRCVVEKDPLSDEFFFYRDGAAMAAWDREGLTAATADTMVHVLYGDESTTFVVEPPPSVTAAFVDELRQKIQANWYAFGLPDPSPRGGASG